ncbi:hypothetical protein ACFC7H_17415 [Enterococcus casseliflavus]
MAYNLYNGFTNDENPEGIHPYLDEVFSRGIQQGELYLKAIQIRFDWMGSGGKYERLFDSLLTEEKWKK